MTINGNAKAAKFWGMIRKCRSIAAAAMAVAALAAPADETPAAAIERLRPFAKQAPRLNADSEAAEVLRACREMLPLRPVELKGALIVRSRKGIVSSEYDYRLVMRRDPDVAMMTVKLFRRGETQQLASATILRRGAAKPAITLAETGGAEAAVDPVLSDRVLDTDVSWLDLTFDFLWWPHAAFEAEREGESVHGQKCAVILARPDSPAGNVHAVRIWVDRKTGCMMQAEQLGENGAALRRIWGRRVKKFDGRWMASELEVETPGSRRRTKITVGEMNEL